MKKIILSSSTILDKLAQRYVWWKPIEWSYQHPFIFLANVMNLGCWDDIKLLKQEISEEFLRKVLKNAPAGSFHYRSWDYWHLKLFGIDKPIPPLPKRI